MSMLIYGAYGYTGRLITREAVQRGHRPVLAGRNAEKLEAWASQMDLPTRVVALTEKDRLRSVLDEVPVVLHCAGPFVHTAVPMVEACLDTETHYLDITGEPDVFAEIMEYDARARDAGVMLMPGIGFDVVPTDCLARFVAEQVPEATALDVALFPRSGISRGTLKTIVERMGKGGLVRREGELRSVPSGWLTRTVDFGGNVRTVVSIPEASVVTSGVSTTVPNATVYIAVPAIARGLLKAHRYVSGLLAWPPLKTLLQGIVEWGMTGPSPQARRRGRSVVWAAAREGAKPPRRALLYGPEPYTFTARAPLNGVEKVRTEDAPSGYHTPSTAFGADFVLGVEGVRREVGPE